MNCFRIARLVAVLASLMVVTSTCSKPETPEVRSAREFRDALAAAIAAASSIQVAEHADASDFFKVLHPGEESGVYSSNEFPAVEYARVRLDETQRNMLLRAVQAMDEAESASVCFCAFSARHTIELHSDDGISSRIPMCFSCGDFQWSARDFNAERESWVAGLEAFIKDLGMRPSADWKQLLEDSGKARYLDTPLVPGEGS